MPFHKILLFAAFGLIAHSKLVSQDFTRIVGDPVVNDGRYCEGASWGDVNGDGYLDLFVPHLHTDLGNTLYINNGDGSFSELTFGPVITDTARSSGGSFGDLDNDGDLDLFVCNYYGLNNFLYLNEGDATFTKVIAGRIVSDGGFSFGSSIADYDNDGFLDIYVTNGALVAAGENNFLYHNNADGTFTRVTEGALVNDGQHSSASAWCDYDNDGDQDLFVANGFTENADEANNAFYQNNGDGSFVEIDPVTIGLEHSYSSNGSWADYDNDGDFDLIVTNFLGNNNNLYQNNGDGTFSKITDAVVGNDGGDSISSTWGDYDNDGDLDLFVTNDYNENNNLYENNGDGTFTKITQGEPSNDGGRSNGASWADYNNDGYLDLFVPNGQRPQAQNNILYTNNGISHNNWINIRCIGNISNTSAIGTRVRAKAQINNVATWQLRQVSGSTGFNAQNSLNIEFGLGQATKIDSLVFEWPSGFTDIYTDVAAGIFYEATERVGLKQIPTSVRNRDIIPHDFELYQNYPNPFNPTTVISFEIPKAMLVRLVVFNTRGQRIVKLVNGRKQAGKHEVRFDASYLSAGVYFYRLEVEKVAKVKKMIYLR